jgi:hypothetical protein
MASVVAKNSIGKMKFWILIALGVHLVAADCGTNAFEDLKKEYKTFHENADKINYDEFIAECNKLIQKFKDFQKTLGDECQEQIYYNNLYVNLLEFYARMDEGKKNCN